MDEDRVALIIGGKGSTGGLYKAIEVYLTYGVKGKIYHENETLRWPFCSKIPLDVQSTGPVSAVQTIPYLPYQSLLLSLRQRTWEVISTYAGATTMVLVALVVIYP